MIRFCRVSYFLVSHTAVIVVAKPCPDRVAIEFQGNGFVNIRPGDVDAAESPAASIELALGINGGVGWKHESRLASHRWTAITAAADDDIMLSVLEYFEAAPQVSPDLPQPATTVV